MMPVTEVVRVIAGVVVDVATVPANPFAVATAYTFNCAIAIYWNIQCITY